MGFYPQPNDYTCGPFALKHALVALGKLADEDDIKRRARTHWWSGTDEIRLMEAAKAYDCEGVYIRRRDPERARKDMINHLRRRRPLMLCVDDWGHWITVLRNHGQRFVVVDSNMDPVLNIVSWQTLRKRWRYLDTEYDPDDPPALYDFFALKPRFRAPARADFSITRIRFLRRPSNHMLALYWDEYLGDLMEICRPRTASHVEALSMGEFLRRHQELILSRIVYWHGAITRAEVSRLLRYFRFVAETYGLVIPKTARRRAIADLSILVTMWAVARDGVGPIYGEGE